MNSITNFELPFKDYLHLTNQNFIQLVTVLLNVILTFYDKNSSDSNFDVQEYFNTFERFFGSTFNAFVGKIVDNKLSVYDKIFIVQFYGSLDTFHSSYPRFNQTK